MGDGKAREAGGTRLLYVAAMLGAALAGYAAVYVTLPPARNDDAQVRIEAMSNAPTEAAASPDSGDAIETAAASGQESGKTGLREAPPRPGDALAARLKPHQTGDMVKFVVQDGTTRYDDVRFQNEAGETVGFSEWSGKVVLVNLWATWCAPCLKEMPSLDRLNAALGGDEFDVVAVSIDRGGAEKPGAFLKRIKSRNLALYVDASGKIARDLQAPGMPTTVVLGRDGSEIGRLIGPAEWDDEAAMGLVREIIEATREG